MVCEWINASPKNRKEFDELDLMFVASLIHAPRKKAKAAQQQKSVFTLRKVISIVGRIAAVVVLALILNSAISHNSNIKASELYTIEVPPGGRMKISLTDGTDVWLNGGTKLEYPAVFSKKSRRVSISGEALFEVAHDAKRPFIVETFACELEVLGTKFNVVADSENNSFQTALLDGSLKVSSLSPEFRNSVILMHPGDLVFYNNGKLSLRPIDNMGAYSWIDGIININGLGFEDIIARLEKAFNVKVVIERDTMPVMDFIGGEFQISYGIENVLNILQYGSDFDYVFNKEENTITIL